MTLCETQAFLKKNCLVEGRGQVGKALFRTHLSYAIVMKPEIADYPGQFTGGLLTYHSLDSPQRDDFNGNLPGRVWTVPRTENTLKGPVNRLPTLLFMPPKEARHFVE